jgi:hypothetical protein
MRTIVLVLVLALAGCARGLQYAYRSLLSYFRLQLKKAGQLNWSG